MACFNALTAVRMLQLLTLFPFFWFSMVLNVFSVLDFLFGFGFGFLVFNETRVFFFSDESLMIFVVFFLIPAIAQFHRPLSDNAPPFKFEKNYKNEAVLFL